MGANHVRFAFRFVFLFLLYSAARLVPCHFPNANSCETIFLTFLRLQFIRLPSFWIRFFVYFFQSAFLLSKHGTLAQSPQSPTYPMQRRNLFCWHTDSVISFLLFFNSCWCVRLSATMTNGHHRVQWIRTNTWLLGNFGKTPINRAPAATVWYESTEKLAK